MSIEEFENLLKKHDWYYHYSDDPKMFSKGAEEDRLIQTILSTSPPEFKYLFDSYNHEKEKEKSNPETPLEWVSKDGKKTPLPLMQNNHLLYSYRLLREDNNITIEEYTVMLAEYIHPKDKEAFGLKFSTRKDIILKALLAEIEKRGLNPLPLRVKPDQEDIIEFEKEYKGILDIK